MGYSPSIILINFLPDNYQKQIIIKNKLSKTNFYEAQQSSIFSENTENDLECFPDEVKKALNQKPLRDLSKRYLNPRRTLTRPIGNNKTNARIIRDDEETNDEDIDMNDMEEFTNNKLTNNGTKNNNPQNNNNKNNMKSPSKTSGMTVEEFLQDVDAAVQNFIKSTNKNFSDQANILMKRISQNKQKFLRPYQKANIPVKKSNDKKIDKSNSNKKRSLSTIIENPASAENKPDGILCFH